MFGIMKKDWYYYAGYLAFYHISVRALEREVPA